MSDTNPKMRIIYKTPEGTVSIIAPAQNWEDPVTGKKWKDLTDAEMPAAMEKLAQKDVPTDLKYKIVETSEISTDRTFRNAWEIDESELTDGVGA
jgi:dsRNA-specific ribonuclease